MIYDSIATIKAIGPKREKLFNKVGVYTVEDMLKYYPRTYEDRSNIKNICDVTDGEYVLIKACAVTVVKNNRIRRGLSLQKLKVTDHTGIMEITWFNQDWISKGFDLEEDYFFYGQVKVKNHRVEMANPIYEKADNPSLTNKIVPLYPLTANLNQKLVQTTVAECMEAVNEIEESLPDFLREKYTLCGIDYAIENIHFPTSLEKHAYARKRLAFEELFYLQLAMRFMRNTRKTYDVIKLEDKNYSQEFVSGLPFKLTGDQLKVIGEISEDMSGLKPMNRLIQGDVGCGKTVVAAASMYITVKNGYQTVMMAPTEILASQHFESLKNLFDKYGVKTALLTGSMTAKQKREVYELIKSGEVNVIVGTHAVIQKEVEFENLALVITDEQHRFGVRQRSLLSQKGEHPHTLVMTATPIPRTLALILYGDLDVSFIRELPLGRKPVDTFAVDEKMRTRINNFMLKQIGEGRQVYIVCPMVENSESMEELKAVTDFAESLKKNVFGDYIVGVIHGKMPAKEKDKIMTDFYKGNIHVLVSTTVIEVGINVPNANTMVIENAERFGLSQLHQLRGRVGRGEHQSYCIMFCDSNGEVARERMKIMTETNDGFVISEKDLQIRGPGEFFGTRQHGLPEFKIANIYEDADILITSGQAVEYVMKHGKEISDSDRKMIRNNLKKIFDALDTVNFN